MSRYLRNHVDYDGDRKEVLSYTEIVRRRRVMRAEIRLKRVLAKGYQAVVTVPFYLDFCSACEHNLKRIGRNYGGFAPVKVKCAIGPNNCPAWMIMRKAIEGPKLGEL